MAASRVSKRAGQWLVVASVVLAVAGSAYALFGPTGRYEEEQAAARSGAPSEIERRRETGYTTLLGQIRAGEQDAAVLVWLVVPITIALVPVALVRTRFDGAARTFAACALLAFSFVTGFSIGLFYTPSALAMLAAAAVGWSSR